LPLIVDPAMGAVFKRNALELVGEPGWLDAGPIAASTDAGDLSHVMPMLHPSHGGCSGTNHAADFAVVDAYVAYVQPAIAVAWTILDLLGNNAAEARRILAEHRPPLTRAQYLAHMRSLARTQTSP
ncbi:MAG: amidohydrolase, partial [Chloroflexota bacterium]|nr:amidohydrolase [Chloroflexota bacterium]